MQTSTGAQPSPSCVAQSIGAGAGAAAAGVVAAGGNAFGQTTVPPSAQAGVSAIAAGEAHALALRDDGTALYALVAVRDSTRVRADAGNPLGTPGDRVELVLRDPQGLRQWIIGNAAPGTSANSGVRCLNSR